jgi:hypothetical protein
MSRISDTLTKGTQPMKIQAPLNFACAKENPPRSFDLQPNIKSNLEVHDLQRRESLHRVQQLKSKLSSMQKDLQEKEKENRQLSNDLIGLEQSQNINPSDKNSILLEKDYLRKEISQISDTIIAKTEEVRTLNCYYQSLLKEHQDLTQTCSKLKGKEEIYDRVG